MRNPEWQCDNKHSCFSLQKRITIIISITRYIHPEGRQSDNCNILEDTFQNREVAANGRLFLSLFIVHVLNKFLF